MLPLKSSTTTAPPLAVSPSEAARIMGLGRTKLYELLSANELKSFKLGARRLIRVSEIEAFLDRRAEA
ncbi:MAG: helix-turn-helix domain-containing protein [Alphaproteobacteria bacterium]|nr:helix-turn-helix domain-containing protein [Alphaproteobacteria bacterium]